MWKRTPTSKTVITTVPRRSPRRSTVINRTREIRLRTGHATIRRSREERDKVYIVRGSTRHTRIRVGRQQQQSRVGGSFDVCTSPLHRRFEAWFRIAIRLFEHRRKAHRRRQDCTAATNSADKRTTWGDGDGPFRSRPVHSLAES